MFVVFWEVGDWFVVCVGFESWNYLVYVMFDVFGFYFIGIVVVSILVLMFDMYWNVISVSELLMNF